MKPWESDPITATKPWEADPISSSVVDEMSTFQRLAAGAGANMTGLALGAKQRLDEAAAFLERNIGGEGVSRAFGMPTAAQAMADTQSQVAEKRQLDAPLMKTTAGRVGGVVGVAVPALATAFVPGGQSLAGSMLTGGAIGAAEPTTEGESVFKNAAIGVGGGAFGYGAGKAVSWAAGRAQANAAAQQAEKAPTDAVAAAARAEGFAIPPSTTNPGAINSALEGLAGKISTAQHASVANQPLVNAKAARAVGLKEGPISVSDLESVRAAAGKAYDAVRNIGTISSDKRFIADLAKITSANKNAASSFPGIAKNDIEDVVAALAQPQFESSAGVDAIRILRSQADDAFAAGNKDFGRALRSASKAVEDQIERSLQASWSDLLPAFKEARSLIAKTYTVQGALNPATGNVSAQKLGSQVAKGKPISGDLKDLGDIGLAFPKAAQEIRDSVPQLSPLDWYAALMSGGSTLVARPMARSAILSGPYQRLMGTPSYRTPLADLLEKPATSEGIRLSAIAGSPQLAQK